MIRQNTRESAIRREEFHRVLQEWLDETFEQHVGDEDVHAGPAWLWVRHGGDHYYLHARSTRAGVREYLRIARSSNGDVQWNDQPDSSSLRARVTVGDDRRTIDGFEFFRHLPQR